MCVRNKIKLGETGELKAIMAKSKELGMQTFDGALFELVRSGRVSEEMALKYADSPTNLKLELKLNAGEAASEDNPGLALALEPLPEPETEQED